MTSTLPTIKDFLTSVKLEQYHEAFLRSGANEQDLELLIQFNDQELSEFTSTLGMLPFHSIMLKNGLRKLKGTLFTDNLDSTPLKDRTSRDVVAFQALIYGRHQSRSLTGYEKAINEAAVELALENPVLLSKKGDLFKLAKRKLLDDGFMYKRGKSRSKLTKDSPLLQRQPSLSDKRQENAERTSLERQKKIRCLEKKVQDLLRVRQLTENELETGSYSTNDEKPAVEAKIVGYEEEKRHLTRQISKLKAQERKHKWYYKRKSQEFSRSNSSSQIADDEFSSQLSSSFNSNEDEEEDRSFSIYSTEITSCTRESDVRESSLKKID